jgi:hypothetical protein
VEDAVSDVEEALQDVRRILTAGLDELVDVSIASMGMPLTVNQWAIPDEHRAAVMTYGVSIEPDPDGVQLHGDVQEAADPEVSVAGSQGYRLGYHWWRTLAAMAPSGEVWAVSSPTDDHYSRDTAVRRVNSSVTGFIEVSWRWHALRPLFYKLTGHEAFYEAAEWYLARLPEIDEALADEKNYPWWRGLILTW